MGTISQLIRNVQSLNVREGVAEVMEKTKDELVKEQQRQMLEGKTSTGALIGKYKDKRYRRKKFLMNPLAGYGNKDLKLTGEFHRGIKIYFFSTAFFFTSTDSKTAKLTSEYGEELWGLNTKHIKKYNKEILIPQGRSLFIKKILR